MSRSAVWCGLWTVVLQLLVGTRPADARSRSSEDFFTLPASTLLEHARSFESADTSSAIELHSGWSCRFDAEQRLTLDAVRVFRIRNASAITELARVEEAWAPWYENRPEIRARVVTAAGEDHRLDPAALVEKRGLTESPVEYSDVRSLSAPLPNVGVGSIVVLGVKRSEHRPFFAQGHVVRFSLGGILPTVETHLEVSAPVGLPLKLNLRGLPGHKLARREAGGLLSWTLALPAREPWKEEEPFGIPDSSQRPRLDFSTGRSWKEIAVAYRELVPTAALPAADAAQVRDALKGTRDRADSIAAIVALLHRRVRYTAIRLGTSGLVPSACGATLARGYGDCKDKGTALIGMLRVAGIPADLALLRTGTTPDVDPELPGMGLFDHAIVRIAGQPPVWVDATAEHASPGTLAFGVEGRRALLLAPGEEGLTEIPPYRASENRLEETRWVTVAERGAGQVVEQLESFGEIEYDTRTRYAEMDRAELLRAIERYGSARYQAKEVDSVYHSPLDQRSEPLRVRFRARKAAAVSSGLERAVITLPWAHVLELPRNLMPSSAGEDNVDQRVRRTRPYRTAVPFRFRTRVEADVPEGFVPRPAAEDLTVVAGGMRIGVQQRVIPTHVTLEVTLDTGARVWTAEQYEHYVDVVDSLLRETGPAIVLDLRGAVHEREDRYAEALAEWRRLARVHPGEALHQEQTADLLLTCGLGEAARLEARRGVEREPRSGAAHREMGYILMHDLVGTSKGATADFAGAKSELRRALAADSTDALARRWLASLLLLGSSGLEAGPGSSPDSAISEILTLRRIASDGALDGPLLKALAMRGRFAEILALDPEPVCEDPDPELMAIVARAGRDGLPATVRYLDRTVRDPGTRRSRLAGAAVLAANAGQYAIGSGLMDEMQKGGKPDPALEPLSALLRELAKPDRRVPDLSAPRGVLLRAIELAFANDTVGVRALFAPEWLACEDPGEAVEGLASFGGALQAGGLGERWRLMRDAMPLLISEPEGDPKLGVRVRIRPPGSGPERSSPNLYLAPGPKHHQLLATAGDLECLGLFALHAVDRGDLASARQWLGWAREEAGDDGSRTGPLDSGWLWWMRGEAGEERHRLRSAAAALAWRMHEPLEPLNVLRRERAHAGSDDERTAFDLAIGRCLVRLRRWAELEPLANELAQRHPDSRWSHGLQLDAALGLGKHDAARAIVAKRQARFPDERDVLRDGARVEAYAGNRAPGWDRWNRKLLELSEPTLGDFNEYAWELLLRDAPVDSCLAMARRACTPEAMASDGALHTLAYANAAVGDLDEASRAMSLSLATSGRTSPGAREWLVLGRIAESLGERELARGLYGRVVPDPRELGQANSLSAEAQRRLKVLGVR